MQHRQRRGLHEAVEPAAAEETYVVAAAYIVDACVRDLRQELPGGLLVLLEQVKRREHANPGGWSADSLCEIRHISTLWPISSAPPSGELPAIREPIGSRKALAGARIGRTT